jgi:hypothetical protein
LGASVTSSSDAPAALREKRQLVWQGQLEPVTVAWDGHSNGPAARLPRSRSETSWQCRLTLESGEQHTWACSGTDLPPLDAAEIEGTSYVVKRVPLPGKLSDALASINTHDLQPFACIWEGLDIARRQELGQQSDCDFFSKRRMRYTSDSPGCHLLVLHITSTQMLL